MDYYRGFRPFPLIEGIDPDDILWLVSVQVPELSTKGRIRSWTNGEAKFQSLNADKGFVEKYATTPGGGEASQVSWRERCFRMVQVEPTPSAPNLTSHLFLSTHNLVNGLYTGECPFKAHIKCDILLGHLGRPAEFTVIARLYKVENRTQARNMNMAQGWAPPRTVRNEETGAVRTLPWTDESLATGPFQGTNADGLFSNVSCRNSGSLPWDLLLPCDCWSEEVPFSIPMLYILSGGVLLWLCCLTWCLNSAKWFCVYIGWNKLREEELPEWMRLCNRSCCGACCCCLCRCYLKAFRLGEGGSGGGDSSEEEEEGEGVGLRQVRLSDHGEASSPTLIKVRPYRPVSE